MAAIINGPNGKYVLAIITFGVLCSAPLAAYAIKQGYTVSVDLGIAQLAFSKA